MLQRKRSEAHLLVGKLGSQERRFGAAERISADALTSVPSLEVLRGREDQNALDLPAEIRTEVPDIARDQVGSLCFYRGKQDRRVFFGQGKPAGKVPPSRIKKTCAPGQLHKSGPLGAFGEVDSRLFHRKMRGAQNHILQLPELSQSRIPSIGSGEKNIGIQKEAIHLARPAVRY